MTEKETTKLSKFLSLVLRHKPDEIGIILDNEGWTDVQILVQKMNITFDNLKHVVDTNSKKRFAFNTDFSKIRASQGHSVEVDLNYVAQTPPDILYHGTAIQNLDSITLSGLEKKQRHHVHLSEDFNTAVEVGKRYGQPVVLTINTRQMFLDGFLFFKSENNVWLTDNVPSKYIN